MAAELVAGIDLATQEVRVVCADGEGRVAATGRAALPAPHRPRSGWSEQDATAWWPAAVDALRQATDALGRTGADEISAVAVAATSGTVVALDGEGAPVGPALLYDDQRAGAEAEKAAEAGADRWDALGFHPSATSGLAKWAWLVAQAEAASRASRLAHASDVVVAGLTGDRTPPTDWSHALKSGYDPKRKEWAHEALDAVGVRAELLPEVRPPTSAVGTVSDDAAAATGLPRRCQVRLGMTDGCAGQVAAGADRPGRFVTVVGTTLVVKGVTEDLLVDPGGAVYSHRHPDGWWLPGGASNTGGAAIEEAWPDADLGELDDRAARRGPARCVTYPLVATGERFPFVASDAEGFWLGEPADDAERHRALLEGVAFVERLGYARLADMGASAAPPLRSAGRGGRSPAWAAIRAAVLGAPLLVAEQADTAVGACILAAAGTLHADLATAGRAMVAAGREVEPTDDDGEREAMEESFGRFVAALFDRGWIDERLRRAASAR
ncbi:MAG TPA: FGGY family carbohydrate kinase [Acidimicrobiales bacterium]|nr:FGGY family carbohydrate kinase [Acidimicrobiales bacterium]